MREREQSTVATELERLRFLAEVSADGVWEWEVGSDRVVWSDRLYALLGLEPSTTPLSFAYVQQIVHPDDLQHFQATLNAHLTADAPYNLELRLRRADGSYCWILSQGSTLRAPDGQPHTMLGTIVDISAQKRNEALLAGQNAILEAIANDEPLTTTLTAIVELVESQLPSGRGALLSVNETLHLTHIAAPSLPTTYTRAFDGRSLGDDLHAFAVAIYRQETAIAADLACDPDWLQERDLALAHGLQACWSIPLYTSDEEVLGIFALYFDKPRTPTATDWQPIETMLRLARLCLERENNRQIQQLQTASMEAAIEGIGILKDNTYRYLNAAHCQLFGYANPDELLGKTWRVLYPPAEIQRLEATAIPALERDGFWSGEALARRRDGSLFPQEISLTRAADGGLICVCRDVTARKATEAALRQSEQRFRQVAEATNDFLYEWDVASDRLTWSGVDVDRAMGYAPGTFPRHESEWEQLIHPADRPRFYAAIARHEETDEPYYQEYRVRHRDGTYRYWSDRGSVVRGPDGTPVKWIGANSDISDRKWAELALQESQQRYATLAESAPVGIFHTDLEGHCLYVNNRWCEITGLSRAEAHDFGWARRIHPDDRVRVAQAWQAATQKQQAFAMEFRFQAMDGAIVWVFGQAVAERNPDGDPMRYIGTITNISTAKETEEALRQSRQLLHQVIDNIPQVIAWKDCNSTYLGCNQRAAQMVGLGTPAEIIGKRDADLAWDPEQAEWLLHCDRRVFDLGQPELHTLETQIQADGQKRWLDTNRIPLRGRDGEIAGLLVTWEDVTEQLAADRRLQSFSASLRHLHRLSTRNFQHADELLAAYLRVGCEMLDLPTGAIARSTATGTLEIELIQTDSDRLVAGAVLAQQDTVCDLAITREATVAVASLRDDPDLARGTLCREYGFACSLSTPIWVDREIYGTLSFLSRSPQPNNFEEHECEIVELMARDIGRFLSAQRSDRQRREAEAALRHSEAKYRSIFENITQGIFQSTPDGRYLNANPFLARLYGYDSPEALMAEVSDIGHQLYVDPHRRAEVLQETERCGAVYGFESQAYRRDGSILWISENQHAVRASDGTLLYYEGTVEDITARRQAEEQLQYDAFHDKLTGLHNRAWFTQQLENAIAAYRRDRRQLYGVLFVDLDRFKVINDSLGHLVGDALLVQVARRLASSVRACDTIARFGGDEFAVLLRNLSSTDEAVAVADRFVSHVQESIHLDGQEFSVGASIGIALGTPGYERPDELLRDADLAMYRAKAEGGGGHAFFEEAMLPQAVTRLQVEHDLQRALELEELHLHYQPIYALGSGEICGFEALLRWHHTQRGWISPNEFIPIAEETGPIDAIGWWAFETSCRQLQQWRQDFPAIGKRLTLHINVSGVQLKRSDFAERVGTLLATLDLPSSAIKIEITETSFFEAASVNMQCLEHLRHLGCGLCIDDFGTGYSSLSRLHGLLVDTIKVDRVFVDGVDTDPTKAAIAQTIVSLAHNLGAKVVSEGIETSQQQQKLQELGCEFGQGYLFSRPVNAEIVGQLLRSPPATALPHHH